MVGVMEALKIIVSTQHRNENLLHTIGKPVYETKSYFKGNLIC